MNSKKIRHESTFAFILKLILYVLLFLCLYGIYAISNRQLLRMSRTAAVVLFTYVLVAYMFTQIYGSFDIGKRKSRPIFVSVALASLFTDVISVFVLSVMNDNQYNNNVFRFEKPLVLVLVYLLQLIIIWVFSYAGNALYFKIFSPEECIVVTSSRDNMNAICSILKKYKLQYRIKYACDYRCEKLYDMILESDTVIIYELPVSNRKEIIEFCYQNMKNILINPELTDVIEITAHRLMLDDVYMLGSYRRGISFEEKLIKRLMDIVISIVLLIICSPILLLAMIAIKLDDGGKVIFKQNRATINGRVFDVYKLRTMKPGSGYQVAQENDERITKVGRILRKYRIDELPQFINVLKGDMSIVGPRPESLAYVYRYCNEMPEYELRLRVKAGITGYAQIAGKYNTGPKDKLILDLMYIEEYSIWMDIKLLFRTLMVLFKRDSAEAYKDKKDECLDIEYIDYNEYK